MADKATIAKALVTIFTELDRLAKKPARGKGIETPTLLENEAAARSKTDAMQARQSAEELSLGQDSVITGDQSPTGPGNFNPGRETLEEKGLNQFQRTKIEADELDPTVPASDFDARNASQAADRLPDELVEPGVRVVDDVSRPADLVQRPSRSKGSIDDAASSEQLDNLFGEEEARLVEKIKTLLGERGIKRSAGEPTTRDRAEAENVTREVVSKKVVDQEAKKVFQDESGLGGIGDSLDVGKVDERVIGPRGEDVNIAVGEARGRLQPIRKEAAQAAARGRESGNVTELESMRDRITASPKGNDSELNSLIKTFILRESQNRKTNQPRSTATLKERIKELGGSKEMIDAIRIGMRDRIKTRGQR